MKIAYIIAAHKDPAQFSRLVNRLNGSHAHFFIHIDRKSNIQDFKNAIQDIQKERITFLKQYDAWWSGFGIVKAEIHALNLIYKSGKKFDFVMLLSGQDYPIKSNEYILNFLSENRQKSFVDYFPMPAEFWPNGGMDRINRYHFSLLGKRFAYPPYKPPKSKSGKIFNWLFSKYFRKRELPLDMRPYGGEHWWNFNWETVESIINFLKQYPEYIDFHKFSFCADEMFFQTLLLNIKDQGVDVNLVNDDLRYYDWSEGKDSPKTLGVEDFPALVKSKKLFARKFDMNICEKLLDMIDDQVL